MDIRSRKTRQTIAKCFPELLRKTPVSKITVTEICAMAKINRALLQALSGYPGFAGSAGKRNAVSVPGISAIQSVF